MKIADCNPFLRVASIQPAVFEGGELRAAYDHRIFYILDGTGELVLAGNVIPLQPDTLLFFAPRTPYYFCGKMRVAVFNFDLTRVEARRTEPICPPPVAALDEALTVKARVSKIISFLLIPYFFAPFSIFLAILTLSSGLSGIPFSSKAFLTFSCI